MPRNDQISYTLPAVIKVLSLRFFCLLESETEMLYNKAVNKNQIKWRFVVCIIQAVTMKHLHAP